MILVKFSPMTNVGGANFVSNREDCLDKPDNRIT